MLIHEGKIVNTIRQSCMKEYLGCAVYGLLFGLVKECATAGDRPKDDIGS